MEEWTPGTLRTVLVHEYVTGGGLAGQDLPASWAAEGSALRRTLVEDFAAVPGVAVVQTLDARFPDEPGPWTTARVGPGAEIQTFLCLADEVDVVLVAAPESEGLLTVRAALLARLRKRSLGATTAAIELTSEKLLLSRHLERCGIATPETRAIFDPGYLPDEFAYPAVLKPWDGAGAIDTFLVPTPDACPSGALDRLPALLQPLVAGTPRSASFLVDASGRAHLVGVGRQCVAIHQGRFRYRGGEVPAGHPAEADEARRAVEVIPGLLGWVGVDFVWDEATNRATVLEINPRVTTSFVGLRRLLPPGTLARAWLAALDGDSSGPVRDLAQRIHAQRPLTFDADGTPVAEEDPR